MKKDQFFASFQKLGKILMAPVMLLPIAGIMLGFGSAFTNASIQQTMPFLTNEYVVLILELMKGTGKVVFDNLPLIFAISIAYGYAKSEKGVAALAAFLGYMTMNVIMGTLLTSLGSIDPANLLTGQKAILGVVTLDTGVFGGIIVGFIVAWLHNKFYNIQLPALVSIFSGTRFVPVITILVTFVIGIALSFIWPTIQDGLTYMSEVIRSSGGIGSFVYGVTERLLLPFGLHHFIYLPFFFTALGGTAVIDGQAVEGAVNIYQAMLNSPGTMFDIDVTRFAMNGKVLIGTFGLTAAALAMYHTARPENKKKVAAMMIAAAIPAAVMGITEPLEYAFLFVAPLLFVIHALFAGIAYFLFFIFEVNVPGTSAFGGPIISTIFNGIMQADKGSNWQYIFFIGIPYFLAYYSVFRFAIVKFNLKTPGREVETDEETSETYSTKDELMYAIIEALGGKENIVNVDACFTRLRVTVKDKNLVANAKHWKELGANGVVQVSNGVQVIYGPKADVYKTNIQEILQVA